MKIMGLGEPKQFQQLRPGDVFKTDVGTVMVKTGDRDRTMAVRLDTGELYTMGGVDSVLYYPNAYLQLGEPE